MLEARKAELERGLERGGVSSSEAEHEVAASIDRAIAFAGWTGVFVTMLNLLPVGQLDGGHISYALFGPKQNTYSRLIHFSLLGMFLYNLARFLIPALVHQTEGGIAQAIGNSTFWLVWFGFLHLVKRVGGRDHPPTEPGDLSPWRRSVAIVSLIFFVLLFMPTPWAAH